MYKNVKTPKMPTENFSFPRVVADRQGVPEALRAEDAPPAWPSVLDSAQQVPEAAPQAYAAVIRALDGLDPAGGPEGFPVRRTGVKLEALRVIGAGFGILACRAGAPMAPAREARIRSSDGRLADGIRTTDDPRSS